ncbi:hypothetical protein FE257_005335 [Aspergillus nanangensis]|uniref:Uncharacterized protein n=1 Tax=Aspergillus nanangensis TaxID=2582783 RepID=A0AAD4GMW3_ASPNN|nr:hypothetical protein FE257_005335 [Aspergillus nanangensis]
MADGPTVFLDTVTEDGDNPGQQWETQNTAKIWQEANQTFVFLTRADINQGSDRGVNRYNPRESNSLYGRHIAANPNVREELDYLDKSKITMLIMMEFSSTAGRSVTPMKRLIIEVPIGQRPSTYRYGDTTTG